ncbi:MAG TPA: urease subunit beta [Candidatus Dormibacteraeota bacterium]|jgi:urease beta subunit|nr:urease subunit beta [Candidatus Dormibacteraeota bacterium]
MIPGETRAHDDPAVPGGVDVVAIDVRNTGDRPVQVGSHYHFFEANRALRFDRAAAYGRRLAIPAGAAVRFEPGETRRVGTVPFAGARQVWGFLGAVDGPLDAPGALAKALARLREMGVVDGGSPS